MEANNLFVASSSASGIYQSFLFLAVSTRAYTG